MSRHKKAFLINLIIGFVGIGAIIYLNRYIHTSFEDGAEFNVEDSAESNVATDFYPLEPPPEQTPDLLLSGQSTVT